MIPIFSLGAPAHFPEDLEVVMDYINEYKRKLCTAEEAVSCVRDEIGRAHV